MGFLFFAEREPDSILKKEFTCTHNTTERLTTKWTLFWVYRNSQKLYTDFYAYAEKVGYGLGTGSGRIKNADLTGYGSTPLDYRNARKFA